MPDSRLPQILVVDDERIIADSLALILKLQGYSTAAAYTGEHAIELSQSQPPDVLITDVIMPGINGFDLSLMMLKLYPQCKVILFSGQAATAKLLELAHNEGHSFEVLAKPVNPQEIIDRIQRFYPLPAVEADPIVSSGPRLTLAD
jgi:DNA-binding NtrC family response regulator